jgi:2-iminobutanoate/2-iminopropanoate deaminase
MREDEMARTAVLQALSTDRAPAAIGPYVQAQTVRAGDLEWIYTSGQIGLDPGAGEMVAGGTAAETAQVMKNLAAVLAAAGCDFASVVKSTIFLADMGDFQTVNEIYAGALGECRPARSTIEVGGLPKGARVEIEMVAVRPGS